VRVAAAAQHQPIIGARIEKCGTSAFNLLPRAYLPILKDVGKWFIAVMVMACACRLYVTAQGMSNTESLTSQSQIFFLPTLQVWSPTYAAWLSLRSHTSFCRGLPTCAHHSYTIIPCVLRNGQGRSTCSSTAPVELSWFGDIY
jgi:hypothetical protein